MCIIVKLFWRFREKQVYIFDLYHILYGNNQSDSMLYMVYCIDCWRLLVMLSPLKVLLWWLVNMLNFHLRVATQQIEDFTTRQMKLTLLNMMIIMDTKIVMSKIRYVSAWCLVPSLFLIFNYIRCQKDVHGLKCFWISRYLGIPYSP